MHLTATDIENESMLFKNESCLAICEYAPNKMVIYGRVVHLFIIHDWEFVMKIEDDDFKNTNKYFINPIQNFDEKTFPFLVMSGESSFNILNVQDGHMEPLINAATSVK